MINNFSKLTRALRNTFLLCLFFNLPLYLEANDSFHSSKFIENKFAESDLSEIYSSPPLLATDTCTNVTTITNCGVIISSSIEAGSGSLNILTCASSSVPGREKIFIFTPTASGPYNIEQSSSSGFIDYFFKAAPSDPCVSTGWTCIQKLNGAMTSTIFSLFAGTSYYLMLDAENTQGTSFSFQIQCLPCLNITSISCGLSTTVNIPPGTGTMPLSCIGPTSIGKEKICSFVPTQTGVYNIEQSSSFGFIDYFYKQGSDPCSPSNWSCINRLNGNESSFSFFLTADTTYYFLLDAETQTGGAVNFKIQCSPCESMELINSCGTITTTAISPGTGTFNVSSSCPGPSMIGKEKIYFFTPTFTGIYNIEQLSSFGSTGYYYKTTAFNPCMSSDWQCMGLLNGATTSNSLFLTSGITYYILVDVDNINGGNVSFKLQCDPCLNITSANCNANIIANIPSGTGVYNVSGCSGGGGFGKEFIYSFIPNHTGTYNIEQISSYGFVDYFYKNGTLDPCSFSGWSCIESLNGNSTSNTIFLNAGSNYYFLVDPNSVIGGTVNFKIQCTPCESLASISICDSLITSSISQGEGVFNISSCSGPSVFGKEKIYSFTPSLTGNYIIEQASSYGFVDYFYKVSSSDICSFVDWTCIQRLGGASTSNPITLTGGITYYFLVDAEDLTGGTIQFKIQCPHLPCNTVSTISNCGNINSTNIAPGFGAFFTVSNACFFNATGKEKIYSFTPTISGYYRIDQSASYTTIDYSFKSSATDICSNTGWTCIQQLNGTQSSTLFYITAGTTYFILLDPENIAGGNVSFSIRCPSSDPCSNISPINACAGTNTFIFNAGSGIFNTISASCGAPSPGIEKIYTFTPSITGLYHIQQLASFGPVNYYFKPSAGGCIVTGWTCIQKLNGAVTNTTTTFNMVAGTEYFILVDPETTAGGTVSFNLQCPPTNTCPVVIINIPGCGSQVFTFFANGSGMFNAPSSSCSFATPGTENLYTFTPSFTGLYQIDQSFGIAFIDYFFKPVANGCTDTGWTCIDRLYGSDTSASTTFNLTAGVQYYILLDMEIITSGSFSFKIICPPFVPCSSPINNISACGVSTTAIITSGGGGFNPPSVSCGLTQSGHESIFTFTPAMTGIHKIAQTSSSGETNYYFKSVSDGCSGTGWKCIQSLTNISTSSTFTFDLIAGTQYYIMLKKANTSGANVTFNILCPVLPCANYSNITCGVNTIANVSSGTGIYNPPSVSCGFSSPGIETIFSFTPTHNGIYQISQSSSFGFINYYFKKTSNLCTGTGWVCIGRLNGVASSTGSSFSLDEGVTYFILLDPETTVGGTVNFQITCPAFSPCVDDINSISDCDVTMTKTIGPGAGLFNPPANSCGLPSAGREKIFSFMPTTTGLHRIRQLSSFGPINYYFRTPNTTCSASGWTCIDALNGADTSNTNTFFLTAGVGSQIMFDAQNQTGGVVSFSIQCAFNSCREATDIGQCGNSITLNFDPGSGVFNPATSNCGIDAWGKEKIYTFTAPQDGIYQIQQSSSFGPVSYLFKNVLSSCNGTGWTCIQQLNGASTSNTSTFNLNMGSQYYLMVDPRDSTGGQVTFTLQCAPYNPCFPNIIPTISSCDVTTTFISPSGDGAFNPPSTTCGFSTPGKERVYFFSPTEAGIYQIQQLSSSGFVNYYFKNSSFGCSATGWTCIDRLNGAVTSTSSVLNLSAGSQSYIMLDQESTTGGTVSFIIKCISPCVVSGITNISACAISASASLPPGNGIFNPPLATCGNSTAGKEKTFTFTPTQTGSFQIQQTSSPGFIDYFFKPVSDGCSGLGWTCIQRLNGASTSTTSTFILTAGVQYYILLDAEVITGGTVNFSILCGFNPCTGITNISGCGVATATTITSGTGMFNPVSSTCGVSTVGKEKLYTFTPPEGGLYRIQQTASFGFINYFYKAASTGCANSGWTCIQRLNGAATSSTFTLTAGIQYYILLDPESSAGGNVSFMIQCPTFNACLNVSSISSCANFITNTFNSGTGSFNPVTNSCGFSTPGKERLYKFLPLQSGNYQIFQFSSFGFVDYFYKPIFGDCISSGWKCIQRINGSATSSAFNLTGGIEYFILLDPENTNGGGVSFTINCPSPSTPTISGFNPLQACAISGAAVNISGTNFTNVSSVKFNNVSAIFTVNSPTLISAILPLCITTGPISITNSSGTTISSSNFTVQQNCPIAFNVKLYIEGFYLGSGLMQPVLSNSAIPNSTMNDADTVIVELHDAVNPNLVIDSKKAVLNISGNGSCTFTLASSCLSYWLVVRHRNGLETWSSTTVLINNQSVSYNFSDAITKAFGNNMIALGDGRFAIYSGDISNQTSGVGHQDGIIESQDYADMENAISIILTGYVFEDLTGDGVVESADYSFMENNISSLIFSIHP